MATRDNALAEVDKLIDWYEAHAPSAGETIKVFITPAKLHKLTKTQGCAPFPKCVPYRGRTLEAVS